MAAEKDGGGFLWASERRGWRSLERHDDAGRMTQNSQMGWEENFRTLAGVAGGRAFGVFSYRTPFYSLLESWRINGERGVADYDFLSDDPGLAQANFGDGEKVFTVQEQTLQRMPRTVVRRVDDGQVIGELPSIAVEPPFVPNTKLEVLPRSAPEREVTQNDVYYEMEILPRDFVAAGKRKYPVIVDVYGGPEHQQVVASMRPFLLDPMDRGPGVHRRRH